jgi:glutamate formiminotransferase / formiminotetrahydrofolate cyclodeaminase
MSNPIVECVPNFSEGRDMQVIEKITDAISTVHGVTLLDVDPGADTNRTVVTFVGAPESVLEAAFIAIATAQQCIDMRTHTGEHPRMGATDVCPLVPVRDITIEECAALSKRLAERVSTELGIPTFLYEAAAATPERIRLPDLRSGEYEALEQKLSDSKWGPDFGPTEWNEKVAKSGGTVIGARPFLIAWNINLNTNNQRKAEKIAGTIREKGKYARLENLELALDENGKPYRSPGLYKNVNAIGWTIEEYGRCQISINMTNFEVTALHTVYNKVRELALQEGIVVTGSELVGLIPAKALLQTGHHYLQQAGENPGIPEQDVIGVAITSLGLNDLSKFDPSASIIEQRIDGDGPLVNLTVRGFTDLLSSNAAAPGGGSTAALCGALSTALSAMVGQLSTKISPKNWPYAHPRPNHWNQYDSISIRAQRLKEMFLSDIDADTNAFDAMMAAAKMPRSTDEEKAARRKAVRAARIQGIETPLGVLTRTIEALEMAEIAMQGNPNARSDVGVAISTARACAEGAWMNVRINLMDMKDKKLRASYQKEADQSLAAIHQTCAQLMAKVTDFLTTDDVD